MNDLIKASCLQGLAQNKIGFLSRVNPSRICDNKHSTKSQPLIEKLKHSRNHYLIKLQLNRIFCKVQNIVGIP
jgi:hypothetical protein